MSEAGPHSSGTIRRAVVWSYVLTGGNFAVTGVVTFVMAAFVPPAEFGVMALALVWVTFAQMLMQHGPAQAVIQREDVTGRHFDAAFWSTLGLATAFAAILAAIAPLWAIWNGTPTLAYVCWALAPVIVLNALGVIPDAILRRRMDMKRISLRVLTVALISGVLGVGAAVAGLGVWAYAVQQISMSALTALVVWTVTEWRPRWGGIGPALGDLRRFSLHSLSEVTAFFVSSRIDALVMGAFFGPAAIGLYRFAVRIVEMVNSVAAGGIGQVSLADLSRLTSDRDAFGRRLGQFVHAAAMLMYPALGILAATAGPLLRLAGEEWAPAAGALRVLCAAGAITMLGSILTPAVQAAGRPGVGAVIGWVEAAVAAISIVAVGLWMRDAAVGSQVLAIAWTVFAVQGVMTVVYVWVALYRVLRLTARVVLLPSLPPLVAGLAALGAGLLIESLLGAGFNVFLGLLLTGFTAVGVAVLLLTGLDSRARGLVVSLVRRG
ncbi:oligosaccharide flippase family protein [Catenuloplanes indicus]|uniref:PST family polysaccharide transporter n=1 Tax=Catenuloplanes indicus TaxID=137267 RepID=A0AAE4AZ91_9ACTN|nr:oligosaccharide flippase family protein [Catenuloplanes indicus]MDQ0368865.1 PST family polysaccharide transporter [Catenuloplanes indicus]